MKYLKTFTQIDIEENTNESVKDWIIAGALALASATGAKGQQKIPIINKPSTTQKIIKNDTSLIINFENEFQSGAHTFSKDKKEITESKLLQITEFIKQHKNSHVKITIDASESLVPNKDIETGEKVPKRGLAKMRALETKELIEEYLNSLKEEGIFNGSFDTSTSVGKTPYKYGEDPRQEKFTKEQWVRVKLSISDKKTDKEDLYKAYAKMGDRIYLIGPYGGGKVIADIYFPTRKTEKLDQSGNLVYGYQDILFRTTSPEKIYVEDMSKFYDGNLYLIPWEWWNGEPGWDGTKRQTTTTSITQDDLDYIKKNFKVK